MARGSRLISKLSADLDAPMKLEPRWVLKKSDKFMSVILHEDQSAEVHWKRWPASYTFTVKGLDYFMVPQALIGLKFPMIVHAYNNPMPYFLKFQKSVVSAKQLMTPAEFALLDPELQSIAAGLVMDSDMVNLGFNARMFSNLYLRGGVTAKTWLIIIGAVVVGILIILQLAGVVHLQTLWGGK